MPKPRPLPASRTKAQWVAHWKKQRATHELPAGAHPDREFLTEVRTPAREKERIQRVTAEFARASDALIDTGAAVTVFGSARFKPRHPYYELARAVGRELAKAGLTTLTGGGPGIMEAANRGAHEAGGKSIGLNIILPHEQSANPYVDKTVEFQYFFTRKTCLVKYSCAYIVMPGGLGTLDELFEAATLVQCGKIGPFPVILMGTRFWRGLREWGQEMMTEGVFGHSEIEFGHVTDSPKEAVDFILASLPDAVRGTLQKPGTSRKRTGRKKSPAATTRT
ncbi:MAG: TIGR00730 family Rossman fold protein [Flavobacteriales bacterium]|nr:TIGR00730 family Rossman fold protein [Flavobacteriales bacterium]